MISYLIRRVVQAIVVVLMASFLVFAIMHWLPGDPILIYVTSDTFKQYTAEEIEALRHEFGLDRPVVVQYVDWLGGVFTGDFGESIIRGTSVAEDLARALPVTLYYGLTAFIFAHLIGIPMGIVCAIRRGKWLDSTHHRPGQCRHDGARLLAGDNADVSLQPQAGVVAGGGLHAAD